MFLHPAGGYFLYDTCSADLMALRRGSYLVRFAVEISNQTQTRYSPNLVLLFLLIELPPRPTALRACGSWVNAERKA